MSSQELHNTPALPHQAPTNISSSTQSHTFQLDPLYLIIQMAIREVSLETAFRFIRELIPDANITTAQRIKENEHMPNDIKDMCTHQITLIKQQNTVNELWYNLLSSEEIHITQPGTPHISGDIEATLNSVSDHTILDCITQHLAQHHTVLFCEDMRDAIAIRKQTLIGKLPEYGDD